MEAESITTLRIGCSVWVCRACKKATKPGPALQVGANKTTRRALGSGGWMGVEADKFCNRIPRVKRMAGILPAEADRWL